MKKSLHICLFFILVISLIVLAGEESWSAPLQWSGNNHWYEAIYVETGIDWFAAKTAAEAREVIWPHPLQQQKTHLYSIWFRIGSSGLITEVMLA
jgi:hypothetical protein